MEKQEKLNGFTIEFLENYLFELQYRVSDAKKYGILQGGEIVTEEWFKDAYAKIADIEDSINVLYINK